VRPLARWAEVGDAIWFVPHGDLHRLPLHALKLQDRYLAERNQVVYTPSASVMRYCETKGSGRKETALVLGDSLEHVDPLPQAREEARTVAGMFGTVPYLGDQATKSVVRDAVEDADNPIDVLHFACHGRFEFVEPLKSCVMLASPQGGNGRGAQCTEESDLTAEQLLQMEKPAELVTLSACESGLSERHPGDELMGLSRALIYAGTPSVLVSLWRVDDESTSRLMRHFYETWLSEPPSSGSSPTKTQALQEAQRHVLNLTGFIHPYYWAPFVLVGDWR
jgi:CHAT domain-containing protein